MGVSEQMNDFCARISSVTGLARPGVMAVLELGESGATVPFIARYRKEASGGMDEVQVRLVLKLGQELQELEKRRSAILESLQERELLTDALRQAVMAADSRARLEDVYLPFKPKRRTRASIAVERGLARLAEMISRQGRDGNPDVEAQAFVNLEKGVEDGQSALAGARDIVAESVSDNAAVRAMVRRMMLDSGTVDSQAPKRVRESGEPTPYEQYYSFSQSVRAIPSHRFLAIRRGKREEILSMSIGIDASGILEQIHSICGLKSSSPWAGQLRLACMDAWKRLLFPAMENEVLSTLAEHCEREASEVFAANLRDLLLAAPYGPRAVIGLDPGIRTGCKLAAVNADGTYVSSAVIFPDRNPAEAASVIVAMARKIRATAVAVGNGTYGREALAFVRQALSDAGLQDVVAVAVSEAGASVYSASDIARAEFPDLDLTVRGAISIARRLQDPLAELVKVEPRSLGVGQYQHDISPALLDQRLDEVVEDCVNSVGVDLNTASAPLLSRVAGIGPSLATSIVAFRQAQGQFTDRRQLLKVPRLGPKAFEQCAGFLRIRGGRNPLDASAVHPERYDLVTAMAADIGVPVAGLVGDPALVGRIDLSRYVRGQPGGVDSVGMPTLVDIAAELKRPGRDPRSTFEAPAFREDVREIKDIVPGMILEGQVTNVAAFGAFVDIGVHQDGLVHISELSERYVKDPLEVVNVGKKVKVRVLAVDPVRRRISLSMKDT
ncbi:MAG TPA: Tex family protein [Myxococcota bacterium]|nr:Tex family protein [Myxococcota bacterium]